MSQFDKKYKDRKPDETIELIKNFFKQRKYDVILAEKTVSEAGTYSCHLELVFNGKKVLHANGKGMNEIFSLASGYAELYERFCNVFPILCNVAFGKKYRELSLKKNGYAYKQGEKQLTIEDVLENDAFMKKYFEDTYKGKYEIINSFITAQTDGNIIGTPFKNIADENDIRYFDHRIYNRVQGSKGFAAGNTIVEAINQGLSELFESYCAEHFVSQLQECYYEIDINSIYNEELKATHQKIMNIGGYEVHYLDLSYNFGYPVIVGLLINKENNNFFMDLGSFPIFDIALERVITEIYQGIKSLKTIHRLIKPYRGLTLFPANSPMDYFIDERIFERIKKVDTINQECYMKNSEASNEEILQFAISLLDRDGYHVYYEDNSLMDEIKAIALYSPDFHYAQLKLNNLIKINEQETIRAAIMTLQLYQTINLIIEAPSKEYIPTEAILNLVDLSNQKISSGQGHIAGNMMFGEWLELYGLSEIFVLDILYSYNHLENREDIISKNTLYKNSVRKYIMLQAFASNCNYTEEEKIKYLKLYGIETTSEELSKVFDKAYIARKVIAEPFYEFYHSKEYEDLVSTYIH